MLSEYLKKLKNTQNLTNQDLADASGVPIGTINRIMAGQTDNPSFQTVADIVTALGGSMDDLVEPVVSGKVEEKNEESNEESHEESHEERNDMYYTEVLQLYKQVIAVKSKWIFRLFVCLCVLVAFIIGVFAFDLLNPSIGFFQK